MKGFKKLREEFDEMYESIQTLVSELDMKMDNFETSNDDYVNINDFIFELEKQDLYDKKMEDFIKWYMKYKND